MHEILRTLIRNIPEMDIINTWLTKRPKSNSLSADHVIRSAPNLTPNHHGFIFRVIGNWEGIYSLLL